MDTTLILARILGAYILIVGAGLLVQRQLVAEIVDRFRTDAVLAWTVAVFELLAALILIAIHNDWSNPLAVVVTLIGWAAAAEATLLILIGRRYVSLIAPLAHGRAVIVWGAIAVLGGAAMLIFGFIGQTG